MLDLVLYPDAALKKYSFRYRNFQGVPPRSSVHPMRVSNLEL